MALKSCEMKRFGVSKNPVNINVILIEPNTFLDPKKMRERKEKLLYAISGPFRRHARVASNKKSQKKWGRALRGTESTLQFVGLRSLEFTSGSVYVKKFMQMREVSLLPFGKLNNEIFIAMYTSWEWRIPSCERKEDDNNGGARGIKHDLSQASSL
jgi:hypothetical protein